MFLSPCPSLENQYMYPQVRIKKQQQWITGRPGKGADVIDLPRQVYLSGFFSLLY